MHTGFWCGDVTEKDHLEDTYRRDDNIKMDLQEVGWGMDWIDLAQGRDRWRSCVNVVMKLQVP